MEFFSTAGKHEVMPKQEAEAPVIKIDSIYNGLEYLVELVKQIRPARASNFKEAELKFRALFYQLQNDRKSLLSLQKALLSQLLNSSFVPALVESGLPAWRGFLHELGKKIKHKLLPPLLEPKNFLYVINHVFYKDDDHVWVQRIDRQLWVEFFRLLGFELSVKNEIILQQLNEALHILDQRAVTLGLEKEIMGSYLNINYQEYSFFLLDEAVQNYLMLYTGKKTENEISEAITKIADAVKVCKRTLDEVSNHRIKNGTSLSQTYILIRIEQHLERILLITDLLDRDNCFDEDRFLDYFIRVITYEKKKNSVREFLSTNLAFLAFKITEHGGNRGKKYITSTRQEYWSMIKSSMGGGFIVSFTALIKNLITKVPLPPFWLGFTYSINYAAGFQLMHETHTTLATKQPAYTASAIAASVDYFKEYQKPGLYMIAITVARTSRTQLASFFGNLIVVFPLAYGLAALYHLITGHYLLDNKEAVHMLEEQHPFMSLSILYACFTGFALFLSGLIGGYIENGVHYGNVVERLKNNPKFKNSLSSKTLEKVTRYVDNNMGALVGNVALGFFLGMAGFFGKIFGIPFDIRHITISSANAAIAYYTTGNTPGTTFLLTVFAGILLVGLFNFLVSFALAFYVAVRSRGVRLKDYPELAAVVTKYFIKYPLDFFYPPKSEMRKNLD
jgi:site-specific recombinase